MRNKWLPGFLVMAALCLLLAAAGQGETDISTLSFHTVGTLARGVKETTFVKKIGSKEGAKTLKKGDTCQIIGHQGNYYLVSFRQQQGYIRREDLALKGVRGKKPLAEESLSQLKLTTYIPKRYSAESLHLSGTIRTQNKIDTLYFYLWDMRKMRPEIALVVPLEKATNTIPVASIKKQLNFPGITAGRKALVIQGSAKGGAATVLFRASYAVLGAAGEPGHITGKCKVSAKNVLTTNLRKTWTAATNKSAVTVDIPTGENAALLTLEWKNPPAAFTVETFDRQHKKMSSTQYQTGFLADAVSLSSQVGRVKITASKGAELITLRVYPAQFAQHAVQQWQPVPDQVDLMVIPTHQDDEFLFMGGTVPYYCGLGKKVAVVFSCDGGRERCREALDGLWTAGLRYHPVFLGWNDAKVKTVNVALSQWTKQNGGKDPRIKIVRCLRRYKPQVVVTHDLNGEYGHSQHKLTAKLVVDAVKLSQDASFDPSSAKQYGTWQVKKLYLHLYPKNQITMDWNKTVDPPFSAIMLAKEGFSKHISQQKAFFMENAGTIYDNRKFGLYYSAVGPDVKKNDFLENVSPVP